MLQKDIFFINIIEQSNHWMRTDLPGVKQANRRDIQEEILDFKSVDF